MRIEEWLESQVDETRTEGRLEVSKRALSNEAGGAVKHAVFLCTAPETLAHDSVNFRTKAATGRQS